MSPTPTVTAGPSADVTPGGKRSGPGPAVGGAAPEPTRPPEPVYDEARGRASRALLVAACIVVVVAGLKAAATLILPMLFGLFLALINLPLLNWLRGKRVPAPLAVAATLITSLAFFGGILFVMSTTLRRFAADLPRYRSRLDGMFADLLEWLGTWGIDISKEIPTEFVNPAAALDMAQSVLAVAVVVLSNFVLVLLIILFVLFEAAGFPAKLQAAFGSATSSHRYENMRKEIQRYLAIKTLISLATGGLVYTGLTVLGIDFALLWGVVAFLLNYIPNLGSIIAAVPAVLVALVQHGPGYAVIVAALYLTVNISLGNLMEPWLMGRRFGLSTLVVFMSLVFWGWVWGPLGMLLSVPLTMILKIMLENTEDMRWLAVLLGPAPDVSSSARLASPADPSPE